MREGSLLRNRSFLIALGLFLILAAASFVALRQTPQASEVTPTSCPSPIPSITPSPRVTPGTTPTPTPPPSGSLPRLFGTVTDNGQPVVGAEVSWAYQPLSGMVGSEGAVGKTDAAGNYRFDNVHTLTGQPTTPIYVYALIPFTTKNTGNVQVNWQNKDLQQNLVIKEPTSWLPSRLFGIATARAANYIPCGTINGRVSDIDTGLTIQDRPITIKATNVSDSSQTATTIMNPSGRKDFSFMLRSVPVDTTIDNAYTIKVTTIDGYDITKETITPGTISLNQQNHFIFDDAEIKLKAIPQGTITGEIDDPDGKPIIDRPITLNVVRVDAARSVVATQIINVTTKDGKYNFTKIPIDIAKDPNVFRVEVVKVDGYDPKSEILNPDPINLLQAEKYKKDNTKVTVSKLSSTLEGTIYLATTTVGVLNIPVTVTEGAIKATVSTDANGHYNFDAKVGLTPGLAILNVAKTGRFRTYRLAASLYLGNNKEDLSLITGAPNKIYGTVFSANRKPLPGVDVTVSDNSGHIWGEGVSDATGVYSIQSYDLEADQYKITGIYRNATVSPRYSLTLADNVDQAVRQDIATTISLNLKYKLVVRALESNVVDPDDLSGDRIANVKITLQGKKGLTKSATTNQRGEVVFQNLPTDRYLVFGEKTGYRDGQNAIDLVGLPDPDNNIVEVYMGKESGCKNHPQSGLSLFWFCGKAANDLYSSRAALWPAIAAKINSLRTAYPEDKNLPVQILIQSSDVENAQYMAVFPGTATDCNARYPASDPSLPQLVETIEITTTNITKESDQSILYITTHEWGHGKDAHAANCVSNYSKKNPFLSVYQYGASFGDEYFLPITDDTYDHNGGGHPQSNSREGYASSFHVIIDHESEFEAKIAGNRLKSLLQETVDLAKGHP